MNSKGPKRKKPPAYELKLFVAGAPAVGKSALIVRFLTKRFIGEYVGGYNVYWQEIDLDSEPVGLQVQDKKTLNMDHIPSKDAVTWPDGVVLVYSITERESFNYIRRVKQNLPSSMPILVIGNKADMVHLRQVSQEEGEILAKDYECAFAELSAAEQVEEVVDVFTEFCREMAHHRGSNVINNKQSLFNRMLNRPNRHYTRGKSDSALPKE